MVLQDDLKGLFVCLFVCLFFICNNIPYLYVVNLHKDRFEYVYCKMHLHFLLKYNDARE